MSRRDNAERRSERGRQQMMADWAGGSTTSSDRPKAGRNFNLRRQKITQKDVAWILEKLAATIGAGIPLFKALGMLQRMRAKETVGKVLAEIQQDMSDGRTLTQAMARRQSEWGRTVIALVDAGETSGAMRENLDRAHEMVMNRTKLRRKVVGAMIYPASVVFITLALVTLLLVVVVPRFEEIYAQLGSQLPFFTRVVVGMSSYVPYLLALIAAMVAFTFAAIRKGRSDDHVAGRIDTIKSRIPLVGNLIVKSSIARIAGTMAGLHSSGVNLLTALDHARAVAGLRAHAKAIDQVREAVADGASVAAAMAQTQAFPDMFVQYIGVGEESGTLGEMLERYSESANEEVEETAGNIVRLIEPAMMVVIGAVIGFFLLALYLPILSIGNQIQ